MRRVYPVLALAIIVLAGCAAPTHSPSPSSPAGTAPAWAPQCTNPNVSVSGWTQSCAKRISTSEGLKVETWIAINPRDPNNIVVGFWDQNPNGTKGCQWATNAVTKDGGQTWSEAIVGGSIASRTPDSPLFGWNCAIDSVGTFDSGGNLYLAMLVYNFEGLDGNGFAGPNPVIGGGLARLGSNLVFAESKDGGLTWPSPDITMVRRSENAGFDFPRIAVDPRTEQVLVVASQTFGPSSRSCVAFPNIGAKRTDPPAGVVTPFAGLDPTFCRPLAVAAKRDGTITLGIVSASDPTAPDTPWYFSRTHNGGSVFDTPSIAYNPNGTPEGGIGFLLAYDNTGGPRDGTLYALYQSNASDTESAIFFRSSHDDGKSWSIEAQVEPGSSHGHQFMPSITVAGDGSIHAIYFDKSWDTAHDHAWIDLDHAVSLDGGTSWRVDRVTSNSFDPSLAKYWQGGTWLGDYLGLATDGTRVLSAYPDTSQGGPPVIALADFEK